jgi:PKD repeat protein
VTILGKSLRKNALKGIRGKSSIFIISMLLLFSSLLGVLTNNSNQPTQPSSDSPDDIDSNGGFNVWSDDFDDGDLGNLYTAYDDYDSGSSNDYGDVVEASNSYSVSGSYSLHIKAVSLNGGGSGFTNRPKAFATSPYLDYWDTSKNYNLSFHFMITDLISKRFVVIETVDVHLLANNSMLEAYSQFAGSNHVIMPLNPMQWYKIDCTVDKASSSYVVQIDGTPFGSFDKTTDATEPRTIFMGDFRDESISSNNLGEGYWDDLELIYAPISEGISVEVDPDRTVNEGEDVTFNVTEEYSGVQTYWDSHFYGFDMWITNSDPDTWLTRYKHGNTYYPGLVAVEYGNGRAVYAPGGVLEPMGTNQNTFYQLYVNAVRWTTKGFLPNQTDVLVIWGHNELVTYHSASWNLVAALSSQSYNVNASQFVPSDLSGYEAVVMVGIGWTWYGGLSQQGYNEGWYSSGVAPSSSEINTLLSFVSSGGGFVSSANPDDGAKYINPVSQPMGVTFGYISMSSGKADRIVNHTVLEKWGGKSVALITNYEWDFGDGTTISGAKLRNPMHTYGDNGEYTVTLTVTHDGGGTTTVSTNITVLNADPELLGVNTTVLENAPRTQGYWNHQCTVTIPYGDHTGIHQGWIDEIGVQSQVFAGIFSKDEVCKILDPNDRSNMLFKARQQLIALWLNIVSGRLYPESPLNLPGLTGSETVGKAIEEIETIILTVSDKDELERAKDIADIINNFIGVPEKMADITVDARDAGSDDLIFSWSTGDTNKYYNDGMGPDPYPSPWGIYPFETGDTIVLPYTGSLTIILTIFDDDNGFEVVMIDLA